MVDRIYVEQIKRIMKDGEPRSQKEIQEKIGSVDRAIFMGYLRCLVDLDIIKSKYMGRTKIYFMRKGGKR